MSVVKTCVILCSALISFVANTQAQSKQLVAESFQLETAVMPTLAKAGDFPVGVTTVEAINPDQLDVQNFKIWADRALTLEIWYPAKVDDNAKAAVYENVTRSGQPFAIKGQAYRDVNSQTGQFPLVVLSHGYTGYRTIMYYLGEHLASHGYVVAAIDHTDSTNEEIDFANAPFAGFPSTLYNRGRDQQFVLDYLTQTPSKTLGIANIDTDNASLIGFSMGGYGAINTVGGCFDFSSDKLKALGFPAPLAFVAAPILNTCNGGRDEVDPRWRAMIAMAPWGQEHGLHEVESLQKMTIPTLLIAGSEDDISGYEKGVKAIYEQLKAGDKYMLVYDNARHNLATHPAPKVALTNEGDYGHYADPVWRSETLNQINNHMTLAFLDCYVKKMQNSCNMLPKRTAATQKPGDEAIAKAWPGFPDRWAVGMHFYRK